MGTSSSKKNGYIIWIDKNVNNAENKSYLSLFKKGNFEIDTYKNIESGLNKIKDKKIKFKDIYLILSGLFYQEFILKFKENLKEIFVVPKIIIFTSDEELFLEKNSNIKDIIENKFYNLGGIQTYIEGVYDDFLINKLWKKNYNKENLNFYTEIEGDQYTFEYINDIIELYFPVFFKSFFEINEKDIFDELTHYLYESYKENKDIKELLEPIDGIPEIPLEILCKYYARLYTIESDLYKDLNKKLRKRNLVLKEEELLFSANKNNYYSITFIKSFYEGIKLGCFNFDLKEKLYRFSCLNKKEIDKINVYIKNKKPGIPAANFYSKTFLSFSEEEETANDFYEDYKKDKANNEEKNLVPVFFHLIKNEDINKSLYSHIKITNISKYPREKEVLFLPFTCFEILSVTSIGEEEKKYIS